MKLSSLLVLMLPLIGTAAAGSITIREAHHKDKPVPKPNEPSLNYPSIQLKKSGPKDKITPGHNDPKWNKILSSDREIKKR
ncbi:hypothetical protein BZA77DRAFT_384698 [Pyronema omphalodes]|nr:hypothetical protein BZA77DRAFT_384698 [Pyronema omphalodes]